MADIDRPAEMIRAFLTAVAVSLSAVTASAAATIAAQPSDMVAVLFATGGTEGLAAVATAAMIVDTAWSGSIVIAVPEAADFASKARAAGAFALIPVPRGSGCLAPKR